MKNNQFTREITVFHGRSAPEIGNIAGYVAIIEALELPVPLPSTIALISKKTAVMKKMVGEFSPPNISPAVASISSLFLH